MWTDRILCDCKIPVWGTHEISVDIYRGCSDSPNRPCLIFLHGGGFVGGDKKQFSGMAAYLSLRLNAVCLSINYRTAPQARFPAPVCDCLGACRWAGENREAFGIGNIYLAGGSPGANIAAMAMLNGESILRDMGISQTAVLPKRGILLNPILDLELFYRDNPSERESVDRYLGSNSAELREKASPISYPQAGISLLILQGTDDCVVGWEALGEMDRRFSQAGSRIIVRQFPNEPHGWFNYSEKMNNVADAIGQYVLDSERKH